MHFADQETGSSFDEEITRPERDIFNIGDPTEDIELCWTKLDKKPKKLTWGISADNDNIKNKAKPDTIESI